MYPFFKSEQKLLTYPKYETTSDLRRSIIERECGEQITRLGVAYYTQFNSTKFTQHASEFFDQLANMNSVGRDVKTPEATEQISEEELFQRLDDELRIDSLFRR